MNVSWLRWKGPQRLLWLLLSSGAAAAWAVAQQLKLALVWRLVAAAAAVAIPLIIRDVRQWVGQDDDRSRTYRAHLRLYSRRRGIPTVGAIRDLTRMGVTPSRDWSGGNTDVRYVPRDRDAELEALLDRDVFVLVIGDSKAGKTRMAAEAIKKKFSERRLIFPDTAGSLAVLLDSGLDFRGSVVWLDDLQRYLEKTGLERLVSLVLGPDAPGEVTVLATIREQAYQEHIPSGYLESPYWAALRRAGRLHIARKFSETERSRAAGILAEPRIMEALDQYGLAEYISAGPDLVEKLTTGMATEPVGAAAVLAAADWSRAGLNRPIPGDILGTLIGDYLSAGRLARPSPDQIAGAIAWAQQPVYAASSLLSALPGGYTVFDYVVEYISGQEDMPVRDEAWFAALASAMDNDDNDEVLRIGSAAFENDRDDIAAQAFARAIGDAAQAGDPLGAYNYAVVLERLGQTSAAERYYRTAAGAGYAPAAHAAGRLLQASGQADEAERFYRAAAEAGMLDSCFALGELLRERNPAEALRWFQEAALAGHEAAAAEAAQLLTSLKENTVADRYYGLATPETSTRIALLGPPGSGKTTFLAALRHTTMTEDRTRGYWNVYPLNDVSAHLLVEFTWQLNRGRFPESGESAAVQEMSLYFVGDITGSRFAPRRLIRRRSRLESKFAVNLLDVNASASTAAGGTMDHYYRAINSLASADGLVYFIDPLAEPDVNFMNRIIEELKRVYFAGMGHINRYFPHQVSVCITKFDHPAVFQEARRNGLVGYDSDGFPTVNEEHAEEFFDLLCRGNFWSSRHGIDYRGTFINNELRSCFDPERIRYFVTSSIGFWRTPGWRPEVHFDPQDFANYRQVSGEESNIRGTINPVNVLEPILSLQQRLGTFNGLHGPVTSLKSSEASLPTPPREAPLRQDARTLAARHPSHQPCERWRPAQVSRLRVTPQA